ncbi:MAG: SRPBCC family protein [Candidatus Solibacter usitatus]|nr:SRPBCC family protein [Candidatus Solibacter usitatus]
MNWILWVVVGLLGLIAAAWGIGMILPKGHSVSRTLRLNQPPEAVWQAVTDYAAMPAWRGDLAKVERLPDAGGHEVWRETMKNGYVIPLETVESAPPRRLVRKIADPKLPFGGAWTYEIAATGPGSALKITEDGEVYSPIFRVVSRFTDQAATITGFLTALAKKFQEEPRFGED